MNDTVHDVDFTRALPSPLKNDESMLALGKAIANELRENIRLARLATIYPRIDELGEELLDVLARDLRVDWYDDDDPEEVKRAVVKSGVRVHKRLGTKYAVEAALGDVLPGTTIEEWFEYGGAPYTFRIFANLSERGLTMTQQEAILARMRHYKNVRSHLEGIKYKIERETTAAAAAACFEAGTRIRILPFRAKALISTGAGRAEAFALYTRRLNILPLTATG